MHTPIARYARHFIALWALAVISNAAWADGEFIDIAPKNESEIKLVLDTLEESINTPGEDLPPIVMMLHGDEAHRFLRSNYEANKDLVDQAAKLAAYKVIRVQICSAWLAKNNYQTDQIFPFVSPVPYGAGELARLAEEERYTEYSVNL